MISALAWLVATASDYPNPEHALTRLLGPQHLAIDAPAGCGKTQALAERANSLVASGAVQSPRRILTVTFSNRATDNLRSRLRAVMGARYWQRVTVTNFHGLARRLILAHGEAIGVPPDASMPSVTWRKRALADVGIPWGVRDRVNANLRVAKSGPRTDGEVLELLETAGDEEALAFERHIRAENQLDFDDLLRYAEIILGVPGIAVLYREHFPVVMVDEVQDLTPQQLRMVMSVCGRGLTAAGDRAQAIYSWAGADPILVNEAIDGLAPASISFTLSYRSAPNVLQTVNAVARLHGATELQCADPDSWPDDGEILSLVSRDRGSEARQLVGWLGRLMEGNPEMSIGVITRASPRDDELRKAAEEAGLNPEVWDDATHNPRIVSLLKRYWKQAEAAGTTEEDQRSALRQLCLDDIPPEEVELRDDLESAILTFRELAASGLSLSDCVSRCRSAPTRRDGPVAPGLHLLKAHKGKGQQFDWVVVLGLEEDQIPHYFSREEPALSEELRVLHVIVSRARIGIVITRAETSTDRYGRTWPVARSRWWDSVEATTTGAI